MIGALVPGSVNAPTRLAGAAGDEQQQEPRRAERAFGGDAEHDEEEQVAGQVQPVGVDEDRGDEARGAQFQDLLQPWRVGVEQRRRHRAPARDRRGALGGGQRGQPQEDDDAGSDDEQRRPRRPCAASAGQVHEHATRLSGCRAGR
jgi:hypothetical protein